MTFAKLVIKQIYAFTLTIYDTISITIALLTLSNTHDILNSKSGDQNIYSHRHLITGTYICHRHL